MDPRSSPPAPESRPRAVLIAATHSGAGKTTATVVLSRALCGRGLQVQPFKLGPDFIDPAYHRDATGRPSINLDVSMMGEAGVRRSYERWSGGADICVLEAMGALFDGADGGEYGSAAHVAKLLDIPVIVVLDVWGMTRTTAALLEGLRVFDPELEIAGCILNRVGSAAHAEMVTAALPQDLRRLVLGAIPHRGELVVPERHLGLLAIEENKVSARARAAAQAGAGQTLDLDRFLQIAGRGGSSGRASCASPAIGPPRARMAIARDRAFTFYYEENLVLLREAGFELVPFRPTTDARLPDEVDAIYIGGGYPESFAAELEANVSIAAELRRFAEAGAPLYAECGGLLYLGRSLTGFDGERRAMSGVLPLDAVMDPEHLAIRYVAARTRTASPLGAANTPIRGQEFHQSRLVGSEEEPTLYEVTARGHEPYRDGYLHRGVAASFIHLHFASTPRLARSLLKAALEARGQVLHASLPAESIV